MISNLRLKFGRAPGLAAEGMAPTPVTVFVGPNNSGKSKILSEIEQYCRSGRRDQLAVILDDLQFVDRSNEAAAQAINQITLPPNPGEPLRADHILVGARGNRAEVPAQMLHDAVKNPAANPKPFCQWFLTFKTLMLDGTSRIRDRLRIGIPSEGDS